VTIKQSDVFGRQTGFISDPVRDSVLSCLAIEVRLEIRDTDLDIGNNHQGRKLGSISLFRTAGVLVRATRNSSSVEVLTLQFTLQLQQTKCSDLVHWCSINALDTES
jgi:hypothetical protein